MHATAWDYTIIPGNIYEYESLSSGGGWTWAIRQSQNIKYMQY